MSTMIGMLGAIREEIMPVVRSAQLERVQPGHSWPMFAGHWSGCGVLLMQTGMGSDQAARAASYLLRRHRMAALVSFGFAGALSPNLQPGDLVLCEGLCCGDVGSPPTLSCRPDGGLLSVAADIPPPPGAQLIRAQSVTVDRPIAHPDDKRALGAASGAMAVEMEGYWTARAAAAHRVPFLAVRAISDTMTQRLPPLERLVDSTGAWRGKEGALYLALHPWEFVPLIGMQRGLRRAQENLAYFLGMFVSRL